MASPPVLDFAKLVAPIPGGKPAGEPGAYYEIKDKIEEARKEIDPTIYRPDDPMRPKEPKKADWKGIIQETQAFLTSKSKDMLVAAWLTQALVKEYGYPGLRDGLLFLQKLIEDCWDRINPPIEDGDMDRRSGPFTWLDDKDRGARFPNALKLVPIFFAEGKRYSLLDRETSLAGKGPVGKADFEKVIQATPLGTCRQALEDLEQSQEHLKGLVQVLQKRMGNQAPGMTGLQPAIEECRLVVDHIVKDKAPSPPPSGDQAGVGGGAAIGTAAPAAKATREEIYNQLRQAAARLKDLEPHSPIPYFIQRAVDLGKLSFPELIKALVREEKILKELNRELGIEEKDEKKK